ncbi:hypothetical protein H310_00324 [Aphanomyces invadans]|uniref:CCDC66 domain-containing protein n=1 Tax=Aphanomyces invadans TaxID=157072 RepID=A0A024UW67_9STRA|nr:hypothetical protein H310_00324 [Aphanomyces invadans]ETW09878.1 hypothetical protein H310_00324 [Aphanomyces invadans]|eukprot:XP_008861289.1 hypothetical protein H310_00324 [Aphanomyces invadans]
MMRRWEQLDASNGRDVQRRRQNEYHAALAEQVRLQEAKKLAERQDRMASQQVNQHRGGAGHGPQVQGGLFAGLGQNHTVGKNSYARGHHVEKIAAERKKQGQPQEPPGDLASANSQPSPPPGQYFEPQQMHPPHGQQQYHHPPQHPPPQYGGGYTDQQHHYMPTPEMTSPFRHQPPTQSFPQQGYHQGGYESLHQDQPPWTQPLLPTPPPAQGATTYPSPPPPSQLPYQQQPSTSHGRRHQLSATGAVDSTRRNAQMEVQSLLKLQMEDNQRRKAEAKRKKDEEERAEMQRIEKELKLQADAFEAEKKAKVKDAAAKQQQLEFDLRVKQEEELKKTNPKLRHKTMHDDAVPLAPVLIQPPPSVLPPEGQVPPIMPPGGASRESPGLDPHPHLFSPRDNQPWQNQQPLHPMSQPTPPPYSPMDHGYSTGPPLYPPTRVGFPGDAFAPPMFPPMIPPMQMQPSSSMSHFMDARLQMLANELASQRMLVEQLVHQAPPPVRGHVLTADDFDKLRREMQDELDRRDAMHRQELEALKAQATAAVDMTLSSRRHALTDNNYEEAHRNKKSPGVQPDQETSPQKPFPGDKTLPASGKHSSHLPPMRRSSDGSPVGDGNSFVSNSPHKPFPGANGQYNIHGRFTKSTSHGAANSPEKPFPTTSGHNKVQGQPILDHAAIASSDNVHGDDGRTFVSHSPHKPFPGANGQYNIYGSTTTATSMQKPFLGATRPTSSNDTQPPPRPRRANDLIENNQDEGASVVSSSPRRPFPGAHGPYNFQGNAPVVAPSSKSPDAKPIPGGNGLHTLTHLRSPRRRQTHDVESQSPPKPARAKPSSRIHPHASPPKAAQRSRHASSPDKPTTEPPHVKPIPRHKTPLTKPNKPPFEVVNLLEGSLDGPSSFIASKNDHATTFKCESTMIYFDGQVDTQQCPAMQPNQLEASPIHMSTLSPCFSSLFAGTNEASFIHTPGDPLNKSLPTAPSAVVEPSTLVASTHPKPSFHVHVVAPPSSWHTLRYGCDESFSRTTGWDGSFDVDTLFEKNTTRRTLLEQLEQQPVRAPQHVEDLVATFRAMSSQKSTRPGPQDEVHATSKWVGATMPKWLVKSSPDATPSNCAVVRRKRDYVG